MMQVNLEEVIEDDDGDELIAPAEVIFYFLHDFMSFVDEFSQSLSFWYNIWHFERSIQNKNH